MTKEEIEKLFDPFEVIIIDKDDPKVIELLERTRKQQEKTKELQRIDPTLGQLFVGNMKMDFKSQEFIDFCRLVVENSKSF
jgi:hypothetical protein